MRMFIIMMITALLSMMPHFITSSSYAEAMEDRQEAPTTDDQMAIAEKLGQEHLKAQIKRVNFVEAHPELFDTKGNFIGNESSDPNSELYQEYQALTADEDQKGEAFQAINFNQKPDETNATNTSEVEQETKPEQPQEEPQPSQEEAPQPLFTGTAEEAIPNIPVEETATQETEIPQQEAPTNLSATEPAFAIPAAPEPMADEIVEIPEISPEEHQPMGIDTVSLENPQGNWLWKRIWWERAEERYEKIRTLVDAIWDSRTEFFVKRNELDRNILRPFYLNVGLEQGELQAILGEINDFLEKKREQQGDLNEQQRMLYESYATEEETLKQLKTNVEAIGNLDHEIDNALGTFMNQINRVRGFEEQAWQNFREIARILNDTKARELYYIIEGAARNIKNIDNYLQRDFLNHFNTLISETAKHVSLVQKQIEALKEKGISFKRQTELLKEQEQAQQAEEEEEEVAPKPKLSWFGWIMSWFTGAYNMIVSIVKIPYNMLFK